jgi:asparagine synthase (glutamine-hydrolysing)
MCGIVGARNEWLLRCGLDPGPALQRAVGELAWRGPDGSAVVHAGGWWLGCARLAITQERSRQPVQRRGRRHVGVLNGAITNARELWARLLPRAEWRTPPNDAWLPLLAVEQQDREALANLRGHHAYAVIDRHTGELVLGQDRYGEKPFFCLVARHGGEPQLVAFASTPAALRCLGMPACNPTRRLAEWFRFGFAESKPHRFSARCWLEQLPQRGLPLVASPGTGRWWRRYEPSPGQPRTWLRAPASSKLRGRLVASVARCVDTGLRTGLLLSGGIDSSCLAVALRELGRHLPAYQFRAEGAALSEREAARVVASGCGLRFRPVDAGPEVLQALPRLTQLAGQPLGDPSILAVHATASAAAADGLRILLGGEGADELFLGYRRYRALASMPRLPWLRPFAPGWSMSYAARWMRATVAADPAAALLAVTPPAFGQTVLAPGLANRRVWRDLGSLSRPGADGLSTEPVERARQADLDGYLRCDLLPKVDIATMAAGLEARCPWLEGDLAELGADRAALGKAPVRAAFANDLPPEVLRLPKHGFALPLDRWFRGNLAWLDLLADTRTQQRPHLRRGGIAAVVDRHRSGRSNLGHGLYLLVACELFLRTLEGENPNSVRTGHAGGA